MWIAGICAIAVGFLLQAAALGNGPITLIQPLLVLELPFTLLLAARVSGGGMTRRERQAIAAMARCCWRAPNCSTPITASRHRCDRRPSCE